MSRAPFTRTTPKTYKTGATGARPGDTTITSLFTRLQVPAGFNDRPYRCCCFPAQHKLVFVFAITMILGVSMISAGTTAAVYRTYLFVGFVGGVVKLISAAICVMLLMNPRRNYVLMYLTVTVVEFALIVLGFVVLVLLAFVNGGMVKWKPRNPDSEGWFSYKAFKISINEARAATGMSGGLLLGLGFLILLLLTVVAIIQLMAIRNFSKYVQDRTDFLVRRGQAKGDMTAILPTQTLATGLKPPQQTGFTVTRAATTTDTQRTMAKPGQETWVASQRPPSQASPSQGGAASGSKAKPQSVAGTRNSRPASATKQTTTPTPTKTGAGVTVGTGYASVYPPTPSEIAYRDKMKQQKG